MILANLLELWSSAWPAGLTTVALGALFSVILLIASEKLKVEVDPKIELDAFAGNLIFRDANRSERQSYGRRSI